MSETTRAPRVLIKEFGITEDGTPVKKFICTNANGLEMEVIDFGAILTAMRTPDREGNLANVALGCDTIEQYEANTSYLGAIVGRFANRINRGSVTIDGQQLKLTCNDGDHHLHGGPAGFHCHVWESEILEKEDSAGVRFSLTSPDGSEGYPGTLKVTAQYQIDNDDQLSIEIWATTDKTTILNLTNHGYWNLMGAGQGSVTDHHLMVNAMERVDVDEQGIPTGQFVPVDQLFDFRNPKRIGEDIENLGNQPTGYDHCYIVHRNGDTDAMIHAATLHEPNSGRVMEVRTTQPGMQVYTSNWMDGSPGSGMFEKHSAVALECQHFPDAPNHSHFPSTVLRPGETYYSGTVHKFRVQ